MLEQNLRSLHIADWPADPFARGAYSYLRTGGSQAPKTLAQPLASTLFFADEATTRRPQRHRHGRPSPPASVLLKRFCKCDQVRNLNTAFPRAPLPPPSAFIGVYLRLISSLRLFVTSCYVVVGLIPRPPGLASASPRSAPAARKLRIIPPVLRNAPDRMHHRRMIPPPKKSPNLFQAIPRPPPRNIHAHLPGERDALVPLLALQIRQPHIVKPRHRFNDPAESSRSRSDGGMTSPSARRATSRSYCPPLSMAYP